MTTCCRLNNVAKYKKHEYNWDWEKGNVLEQICTFIEDGLGKFKRYIEDVLKKITVKSLIYNMCVRNACFHSINKC